MKIKNLFNFSPTNKFQIARPVIVAEAPLTCVAKGGGSALEIMDKYDIDLLSTE